MSQDFHPPFGDNSSAKADDFKTSESCRWVRLGIWLLLMLPLIGVFAYILSHGQGSPGPEMPLATLFAYLILTVVSGSLALALILAGIISLGFSPEAEEKAAIKRCFWAYGIAGAATVGVYVFDLDQLEIFRKSFKPPCPATQM